jgi:hypothetical protein
MNLQQLFWTKNITPQRGERWAYEHQEVGHKFHLNWKKNEINANKLKLYDSILLRQKGYVTHVVKVLDNELQYEDWVGDFSIYRLVETLWVIEWDKISRSNKADQIFSYPVRYHSGNVMDLRTLPTFQNYWDKKGGIEVFQKRISEMIGSEN